MIDKLSRREKTGFRIAVAAIFICRRIDKFDLNFCRRKGHAIELKITGFLDLTIRYGDMSHDRLPYIRLPYPYATQPLLRDTGRIDQAGRNGKWPHSRTKITAITTPIDKGLIDRDLNEEIIDIMIRARRFGNDHRL